MRIFLIILTTLLGSQIAVAQSSHKLLKEGDQYYNDGQYDMAEESYRKAKEKDSNAQAAYNLGNSLYEQERYEEALNQFQSAIANTADEKVKGKAYYNLGNAQVKNEKLAEGIEAYKKALELNGEDEDAMTNLLNTKMMLKQMQQQQQQQQQQQEGEKNDEESEQQEQQEQEQPQQSEDDESQDPGEQKQEQPSEEKKELDKEDARKLLEIIDNEEKKVQEKLRKMNGKQTKPEKDW